MKYYKQLLSNGETAEITYDQALDYVLSQYKDNDMSRDMLTIPNRIMLRYSNILTEDDNGLVLMAGLYNQLPLNAHYDEAGNRLD